MALKENIAALTTRFGELQTALGEEAVELKSLFDDLNTRLKDVEGVDLQPILSGMGDAINRVKGFSDLAIAPDTEVPTTPLDLAATVIDDNSVGLTWSPSTDNVGIKHYEVFQDGASIGTSPASPFTVVGLTAGTAYVFAVRAVDNSDNPSLVSASASVTTSGTAPVA